MGQKGWKDVALTQEPQVYLLLGVIEDRDEGVWVWRVWPCLALLTHEASSA